VGKIAKNTLPQSAFLAILSTGHGKKMMVLYKKSSFFNLEATLGML